MKIAGQALPFFLLLSTAHSGGKDRQEGARILKSVENQVAGDITLLLERWADGEAAAVDQLAPLVYNTLRGLAQSLMRDEREGHTLQATALVHEVFEQLLQLRRVTLKDSSHFYTFSARLMRRILIDHARRVKAAKRGQGLQHLPLDAELAWVTPLDESTLDLSAALEDLEQLDAAKAHAVELRYFLGCTVEQAASILDVSPSKIERDVRFSLAWLYQRLHPDVT